ncbi:hypothetical protein [Sediminitomix flava]|uniref:Uncharacterized protein n=1 Tax=Sediminitomix flava TaxID=379075 RepID=A0A315Z8U0_SEDFL|nr:hypothetical protein [Sediminitomix flava]PWJ40110.1 hypothetical protein BC781_105173 [Sediminitomix flava]
MALDIIERKTVEFKEKFSTESAQKLVDRFNYLVADKGWNIIKQAYIHTLQSEIISRDLIKDPEEKQIIAHSIYHPIELSDGHIQLVR